MLFAFTAQDRSRDADNLLGDPDSRLRIARRRIL